MQLINKGNRILELTDVTCWEKKIDDQLPQSPIKQETFCCCCSLGKWELNALEAKNGDNDFVIKITWKILSFISHKKSF